MVASASKSDLFIQIEFVLSSEIKINNCTGFGFLDLWVKFFQAAGVPSAAAATYAHIFYENRMDLDMLTDLNKEYLREMGITPMGDIISILRYQQWHNNAVLRWFFI